MATISDGKWNYSIFTWYDYDLQISSFSKILDDKTIEDKGITEDSFSENELYLENTEENKTKYNKDEYTIGYLLLSGKKYYGYIKKTMLVLIGGDTPQQPYPTHTTIKEQTEKTEQLKTTLDSKVDSIGNIINTKIKEKPTTLTQVEDVLNRKMLGIGSLLAESQIKLIQESGRFTVNSSVTGLAVDNNYIYASTDREVTKLDKNTMQVVGRLSWTNYIQKLIADDNYIYLGDNAGIVAKLDKNTVKEVGRYTGNAVTCALAQDGNCIYVAHNNETVRIGKHDMQKKTSIKERFMVTSLAVDTANVYVGVGTSIMKRAADYLNPIRELSIGRTPLSMVEEGGVLFVGTNEGSVMQIYANTLTITSNLTSHIGAVKAIASDTNYVYSGSGDKTIKMTRRLDSVVENHYSGHAGEVNAIASDTDYVYSGGSDGVIIKWAKSNQYEILYI